MSTWGLRCSTHCSRDCSHSDAPAARGPIFRNVGPWHSQTRSQARQPLSCHLLGLPAGKPKPLEGRRATHAPGASPRAPVCAQAGPSPRLCLLGTLLSLTVPSHLWVDRRSRPNHWFSITLLRVVAHHLRPVVRSSQLIRLPPAVPYPIQAPQPQRLFATLVLALSKAPPRGPASPAGHGRRSLWRGATATPAMHAPRHLAPVYESLALI